MISSGMGLFLWSTNGIMMRNGYVKKEFVGIVKENVSRLQRFVWIEDSLEQHNKIIWLCLSILERTHAFNNRNKYTEGPREDCWDVFDFECRIGISDTESTNQTLSGGEVQNSSGKSTGFWTDEKHLCFGWTDNRSSSSRYGKTHSDPAWYSFKRKYNCCGWTWSLIGRWLFDRYWSQGWSFWRFYCSTKKHPKSQQKSLTADYLAGKIQSATPPKYRMGENHKVIDTKCDNQ